MCGVQVEEEVAGTMAGIQEALETGHRNHKGRATLRLPLQQAVQVTDVGARLTPPIPANWEDHCSKPTGQKAHKPPCQPRSWVWWHTLVIPAT
jgi:hypothetical protein